MALAITRLRMVDKSELVAFEREKRLYKDAYVENFRSVRYFPSLATIGAGKTDGDSIVLVQEPQLPTAAAAAAELAAPRQVRRRREPPHPARLGLSFLVEVSVLGRIRVDLTTARSADACFVHAAAAGGDLRRNAAADHVPLRHHVQARQGPPGAARSGGGGRVVQSWSAGGAHAACSSQHGASTCSTVSTAK